MRPVHDVATLPPPHLDAPNPIVPGPVVPHDVPGPAVLRDVPGPGPVVPLDVPGVRQPIPSIKLRRSGPEDQWMVAGQHVVPPAPQWPFYSPGVPYNGASHGFGSPPHWIYASPYSCPTFVPRFG